MVPEAHEVPVANAAVGGVAAAVESRVPGDDRRYRYMYRRLLSNAFSTGAAGGFGGATVFRGGGLETAGLTSEEWTGWDNRRALCSTLG